VNILKADAGRLQDLCRSAQQHHRSPAQKSSRNHQWLCARPLSTGRQKL